MVLSIFSLLELIIPQSLYCLKCTSPKLLHFFVPALPTHHPHCVAGCFLSYDSTASSSLTGSFIPLSPLRHPSFAFSSSLLSFSLYYRLRAPASALSENSLILIELHQLAALTLKSQGKQNTFLVFMTFCYVCGWMWGSFISTGEGSNHVGFRHVYVAACGTCNSR